MLIQIKFSSSTCTAMYPEILLILQLETDYFSKLFISEMHLKQWHYSLHRDFQNCYSTRRSPTGFFKLQFYTCTLHYNPGNSPSRIQFYMRKTKSSSSTTTTYRGQRTFTPEKKFILRIEGKEIF